MMRNITDELKKQYKDLSEKYDVLGVFLYGSQNYGCDMQDSDIDTKAIIVPSLDDLIFRKPISKTVKMDVGECDVKDIREMFHMWKKQNVNFLEILFTDYFYVTPRYESHFKNISALKGRIIRYDEKHAVDCILGLFNRELKRLFREDDPDVIRYGYRRKSYCNVLRLCDAMERYTMGESDYKRIISTPEHKQYKTRVLPIEMVKRNVEVITRNIEQMHDEFTPKPIDTATGEQMDKIVRNIIIYATDRFY